ncbi:hypothetical protein H072_2982 [Dactylellina haptotyla CBS 200.50]|uniref:Peptidase S9 prolyl oligopeptidase catalytic domain-containing protein n=1 Tax=Dactylellina haptotyla (strain CBS 200.50) TaxID=1284197 RepID=S8BU79_DACHA|nr:hypothetical protein H072_2982 [Dactylellina haptotyla CBS 200.50]
MDTLRALPPALLLLNVAAATLASQNLNLQATPLVQFSPSWDQLGPFQIGTRETEWGADPLERYGGFQNLQPDENSTFRSSLARNGTIKWTVTHASTASGRYSTSLIISFPDVDWSMMQSTFGWSGLQFQAWVRGYFEYNPPPAYGDCAIVLHTKQVQEIWIDGEHFFGGDVYGYGRAPIVLNLKSELKQHIINIRAFNDIRMFGGRTPPQIDIELIADSICEPLSIVDGSHVFPDIVAGKSAGKVAAVGIRNNWDQSIDILDVQPDNEHVNLGLEDIITIAPQHARPVKLSFGLNRSLGGFDIVLKFRYQSGLESTLKFTVVLRCLDGVYDTHKYTYVHPSGTVSYAILRPPSAESGCENSETLPILLSLHGAGVDADSEFSRNTFDGQPNLCAWLVIPSGGLAFWSDDWHAWGMADYVSAVSAIKHWRSYIGWDGPDFDGERIYVMGHSNGGQGAWYALIGLNDKVIGGSPISGYLCIPEYVPYVLWQELEPQAWAILQSSMNPFRLELLAENLQGLPIFNAHGERDDNVPVFSSRRMFEILGNTVQVGGVQNQGYIEYPQKGHWWDGIMTYEPLGSFLSQFFSRNRGLPQIGTKFTVVVGCPNAMGSRGGFHVIQLLDPSYFGRIEVEFKFGAEAIGQITTSNIRRFEFNPTLAELKTSTRILRIDLNGQKISIPEGSNTIGFLCENDNWSIYHDNTWKDVERYGFGDIEKFISILFSRYGNWDNSRFWAEKQW